VHSCAAFLHDAAEFTLTHHGMAIIANGAVENSHYRILPQALDCINNPL